MEPRDYQPGDVILNEGDPTDFVYRIISGTVEIYSERDGQTVVLGTLKPGILSANWASSMGSRAALPHAPRTR